MNREKGNKNLRIPVLEDHEFSQSKDFWEKPRPYTFQMGSRTSLEIKNKNIHVLDCKKSSVQYALYFNSEITCCYSCKSWSIIKTMDSFKICLFWGFKNWPWNLNFNKICLSYPRSKTKSNLKQYFVINLLSWFSQPNLGQIYFPVTVLQSSGQADSETVPGFDVWPILVGVIKQNKI